MSLAQPNIPVQPPPSSPFGLFLLLAPHRARPQASSTTAKLN